MIFNEEYDLTLFMILLYDKKHRLQIAKLINSLPVEIIESVQKKILNFDSDGLFYKAVRSNDGITTMFNVKIMENKLKIKISRWIDEIEEIYELDLVPLKLDVDLQSILFDGFDDDIIYIGGYSSKDSRLSYLLGNVVVSQFDCIQYELYKDINGNAVIQLSGDILVDKIVNLENMPININLFDLSSKKNINKLVKYRRRR